MPALSKTACARPCANPNKNNMESMEEIRIFVEKLIELTGLHGPLVVIARHILLILVAVLLAWVARWICVRALVPLIHKFVGHTEATWDDVLFNDRVLLSACNIVPAVVVWKLLPLVFYQFPLVRELLERATAIYITVMTVRTLLAFIDSFNMLDMKSKRATSTQQYLRSFCGVLKILLVFVATIIVVAIIIDKSPLTLFAGLGATSAILMLVFKDTIEGLVAGIRLTSNNMLHRGDWITVPGTQINGIVRDITLSTVKVQNFDNTIITISPKTLVNGTFQNWIGMQRSDGRRVQRVVYFDIKTIAFTDDTKSETNIGRFRKDMERWLAQREDVNSQMMVMVRQMEATQCGVPLEFYFFLKQKEWKAYEEHLADIMEYIYAKAPEYDIKVYEQYPEQ